MTKEVLKIMLVNRWNKNLVNRSLLIDTHCEGEVEHGPPVERLLRYR